MVKEIRIYVEGGGNSAHTKATFREGMSSFFRDLRNLARSKNIRWYVIPCGGREQAFDDFQIALKTHPDAFNVLLVDSEAPLHPPDAPPAQRPTPWQHLHKRDGWTKPDEANDEQCHFMVQCMESRLIADPQAVQRYYGQEFNSNQLPRNPKIENIDKQTVTRALEAATRSTNKGIYQKIRDGSKLLELVDVTRVRQAAPSCERLFTTLTNKML